MDGVLPFAASLDTLGLFTPTPQDMLAVWGAMGYEGGHDEEIVFGVPDPLPSVDPEMRAAVSTAVDRLRASGAAVVALPLAPLLDELHDATVRVMLYEGARFHRPRYEEHGERIGVHLVEAIQQGLAITNDEYAAARRTIDRGRERIRELFADTPVILVPASTGPAPRGLDWTGDARMNTPWTAIGSPAIAIPLPVDGLPLGLQLVAAADDDARVLRAAVRVAALLAQD
jgi:Asp-tRNA(Asn)/Glu-tRNA(Gln) amidotransferase A subunit family amidase